MWWTILQCWRYAIIALMQLELFPFDVLNDLEKQAVFRRIRNHYWYIRNLRGGRFGQARVRKQYRMVQAQKKRLLMAGVSRRELLDFLACCRLRCSAHKHPFELCEHCPTSATNFAFLVVTATVASRFSRCPLRKSLFLVSVLLRITERRRCCATAHSDATANS